MRWRNTETPTFAGSDGTGITGPDVVEVMQLLDRNDNVVATYTKTVGGEYQFAPQGSIQGLHDSGTVELSETYEGASSHQTIWADLELGATAGSDTGTDPKFLAAGMFNTLGANLTNDSNTIAGVIGALSITGTKGSDYTVAGVIGLLFDGVQADCIVAAILDGDDNSGNLTNARAAFGVAVNNNVAGSGCNYGLSLYAAPNTNYGGAPLGFVPLIADIEFSNQQRFVCLTTAITANSTLTSAPIGSIGITSHATGRGKLFMSDGTKWQFAVVA
jgi:hypothetical protein